MSNNPYSKLAPIAFWKTGVAQASPFQMIDIYKKRFLIDADAKIAAAGSCFAQHISKHLRAYGYHVLDVEPPPPGLPEEKHKTFGFSTYSARYGNIYTARQLLQLAKEALGEWTPQDYVWEKNSKFYDGLRPAVEPEGHNSREAVIEHRQYHLEKTRDLFKRLDILVFTLGLTEMWVHAKPGTVFPTAPGTVAGRFDPDTIKFENATCSDVVKDFNRFQQVLLQLRNGRPFKVILTVSPIPLTATGSGKHVLEATSYSKSTLRAAAGELVFAHQHIDYFPSYEIITNPRFHSISYHENLRTVREEAVSAVMSHFFAEHQSIAEPKATIPNDSANHNSKNASLQCEEALLEAFAS